MSLSDRSKPVLFPKPSHDNPRQIVKDVLQTELTTNETPDVVTFNSPLDMHVHFRTGDMMNLVAPYTAQQFCGAVIMPNVMDAYGSPVLVNSKNILEYQAKIKKAVQTK